MQRGIPRFSARAANSNGSRFFILLDDVTEDQIPPDVTLVGRIKEGHEPSLGTLDKIAAVEVGPGPDGELSAP